MAWLARLILACPLLLCSCGENKSVEPVARQAPSVTTATPDATTPPATADAKLVEAPTKTATIDDPPKAEPTAAKPTVEEKLKAANKPVAAASEEEGRQRQIIERFLSVLEANPRRGTALDKI